MTAPENYFLNAISIHGLRGEPDVLKSIVVQRSRLISIHGLRGEPDYEYSCVLEFCVDFNPRAPRGARPNSNQRVIPLGTISIHGLRGEPDASYGAKGKILF